MPPAARTLALAERFHMWPGAVDRLPADEVLRWLTVMGVEGEVLSARAGLPPTEQLFWEDEDED